MNKFLKNLISCKNIITLLTILAGIFCAIYLFVHIMSLKQKNMPFPQPGFHFNGFKEYLKNVDKVGYLTSKPIDSVNNDGFYLLAQFALAPTIIEVGNADNEYIIIDSVNMAFIVETIKNNNLTRVTNNLYGQALYKRN